MKKIVIVIPVHNPYMIYDEKHSLLQVCNVLGRGNKYDITIVCPQGMDTSEYEKIYSEVKVKEFNENNFKSIRDYCLMMTSTDFYRNFDDYEYMLVYQLDCWIFNDNLEYWCNKGYDYIGAPFFVEKFVKLGKMVGNGGFSLRKIDSMIKYTTIYSDPNIEHRDGDDGYFAMNYGNLLKIPDINEAMKFSMEVAPEKLYEMNKEKPFGCHAFRRYNWLFWKDYIDMIDNEVTCCILTYNETENAKRWYHLCKDTFNSYIIDTKVKDNNEENPYVSEFGDDSHIILMNNVYNGGQRIKAYELMKESDGKWLMTSDAEL